MHVLFGIVLPPRSRCRLPKHAAARSQVATSGVDLEIPSGRLWIKRTPLPGTPTINRISSATHRGISRDGRFVGGGARNQEPDGDTRRIDNDLDKFGPSHRSNTLRPISLVYCIDLDDHVDVCILDGSVYLVH